MTFRIPSISYTARLLASALLLGAWLSGPARATDFLYTVQPGDHPWNIAERYLRNPALAGELRRLNRIPDARRIAPGTQLRIPQAWLRLAAREVRLLAVAGEVSLLPTGAAARDAAAGEMLRAPSVLRTGPTGSASLLFDDGSRVLVLRDSELRLQQSDAPLLGPMRLIVMELLRGGVENEVAPRPTAGGRFEIHTPAATAAVRGTHFRVRVQDEGTAQATRTEVLEGAVQVGNAAGPPAQATAGQGSVTRPGHPPEPPVALLPAPDLGAVPERIERLPIDLPLTPLPGAVAYRTQVVPDAGFDVTVSDEQAAAARVRARDIADGRYVLRVRGVDAQGLEGLDAQRVLEVRARPEPPLPLEPTPDTATTATRPTFRWTQGPAGLRYRLQVHAQGASDPIVDSVVDTAQARPGVDLPPGIYRWRVAAIDSARGQGPWGDAQTLRVALPGPQTAAEPPSDGRVQLRWAAQPGARHYRLQLSLTPDFDQPLQDLQVHAAQHALQDLAPGTYHLRIQAVGEDGYVGPWGSTQSFSVPEPAPPARDWRLLWLLLPLLVLF